MGFPKEEFLGFRKAEKASHTIALGTSTPEREAFLGAVAALAFRSPMVCTTPVSFLHGTAFSCQSCCWH